MAFFWTSLVLLTVLRQAASQGAYLGCYVDQEDARDFPYVMTWSDLTPQKCIRHCADLGYAYAGLQYAVEYYELGTARGLFLSAFVETAMGPTDQRPSQTATTHAQEEERMHVEVAGGTLSAVLTEDQLELVFEDNFDTLDLSKWQPEITAGGGGQ
ncbi:hypothetical protein Bbelb_414460 [Branchiostoma belcheri]|nr:hypothetical protein Bbelb_414460 [Branchiostoma belcheri]